MKSYTIFTRLIIGNMIILVLVLILGMIVSRDLQHLEAINYDLVERYQKSIFSSRQIIDAFDQLVQFDEKYFVTTDADYFNRFNNQAGILKQGFDSLFEQNTTDGQHQALTRARQAFLNYLAWFKTSSEPVQTGKTIDTAVLRSQRQPLTAATLTHMERYLKTTNDIVTHQTRVAGQMIRQILKVTVITTFLTFLAGVIITLLNTRSIRNSVHKLQDKTKEIARGRFEEIRTTRGPKEIQDLAQHFNTMCRRLKELDDLKADFISHVSHELRTPLTSIKEAGVMLTKGYYKDQPEKQMELFELIHDECRRLLQSVMRTLDFSKMEAGKMEYHITQLDLPDVIRQSILKLAPLAQKKQIVLEFEPPQSGLPDIKADRDRMIEVLDNLVGNAIKFTPTQGKVFISCSKKDKNRLLVSVTDNGPGIPLEHLDNIFYKFEQIDNELNTRMGSGLGLCLSKYIIKAHGGRIWAENIEPIGTRVSFVLPAASS